MISHRCIPVSRHRPWYHQAALPGYLVNARRVGSLFRRALDLADMFRYSLESSEMVTCIKTMNLETSEVTSNRRDLVVVGTAVVRGEDLSALGRIYVFDIINVVPDPDVPYSDRKLKLIAKEEVKGAVTALSDIGSEGFLLVAQGQKCMVRGLKEDGTLLPVAFIDMQCYVSVAKELKGTGLCLIGDAIKGVWFTGYTVGHDQSLNLAWSLQSHAVQEEPYQLRLFGKTSQPIEVMTADFLPDNKQLYIIAVDLNSDLHVLQFDPEREFPCCEPSNDDQGLMCPRKF